MSEIYEAAAEAQIPGFVLCGSDSDCCGFAVVDVFAGV